MRGLARPPGDLQEALCLHQKSDRTQDFKTL